MNETTTFNGSSPVTLNLPDVPKDFGQQKQVAIARMKRARDIERAKKLIWIYFWLLIFEGSLRKWIVPSLSTPLLVVRDPIVIAIYFFAWRAGVFPRNVFVSTLGVIAIVSLAVGVLLTSSSVPTALYGFRADFLHLPLIFVMGHLLTSKDIKQFGYWTFVLSIPLAILMVLQFLAPPLSIVNAGVMGDFEQITGAGGRIRPPATFSFVTGPIYFFGAVAAFLVNEQFSHGSARQAKALTAFAAAALLLAMSVSISRSLIVNVGLVFVFGFVAAVFLQPQYITRWLLGICLTTMLLFGASNIPIVQLGFGLLLYRSEGAASSTGAVGSDMVIRVLDEFTRPVFALFSAPFLGHGLGLGTNGGIALAGAGAYFISQEGEWSRNILESGPILGSAFILWRVALTLYLGWMSVRCAILSNVLPLLLFAICGVLILNGMFPQPTALGFAAFISGLCCASMKMTQRIKSS